MTSKTKTPVWQDADGRVYALRNKRRCRPVALWIDDDDKDRPVIHISGQRASVVLGADLGAVSASIRNGWRTAGYLARYASLKEAETLPGAFVDHDRHRHNGSEISGADLVRLALKSATPDTAKVTASDADKGAGLRCAREGRRVVVWSPKGNRLYPMMISGSLYLSTAHAVDALGGNSGGWNGAAHKGREHVGYSPRFATIDEFRARYPLAIHEPHRDVSRMVKRKSGKRKAKPSKRRTPARLPVAAPAQPSPREVTAAVEAGNTSAPLVRVAIKLLSDRNLSDEAARASALAVLSSGG